jgi:hypothetical protein
MEWISVEKELPIQKPENIPTMNWVLITCKYPPKPIAIGRYNGHRWEFLETNEIWTYGCICGDATYAFDLDEITHWMPLPEPPKE